MFSTKNLLYLAALWNLSGAGLSLVSIDLHLAMFYTQAPSPDFILKVYHVCLWGFVAVMGLGYVMAGRNFVQYQGVLWVAIPGKLLASLVWLYAFAIGQGTPLLLVGALGDMAWAGYFVYVLKNPPVPETAAC